MMLVIGIIGVLSTIIIGGLSALKSRARDSRRVHDFEQFKLSLDMFYGEYGNYPCGDSFSLALGTHWDSSFSCPFLDGNAGSASIALRKDSTLFLISGHPPSRIFMFRLRQVAMCILSRKTAKNSLFKPDLKPIWRQ